ncbi:MAG: fatty acyl-AMP ligase [Proteobacteria bacterium]|nr:fatty acyl-AMP ligase [Pseudomonadota bacterium]
MHPPRLPQAPFQTLLEALQSFAEKNTTAFCFVRADGSEREFSKNDLYIEITRRAAQLRNAGLQKGERLLLVLPEGEDFVPTFFAALWAGVVPVPVYPPMSLGKLSTYVDTLAAIVASAQPKFACAPQKLENVLWPALSRTPSVQGILPAQMLQNPPSSERLLAPENILPEDTCFLQFTSGSTSTPKGVEVSHANLVANCKAIMVDGLQCHEGDVTVSWLPLYHDMGLIGFIISPTLYGLPSVILPTTSFIRNPGLWLETIHRKRGTLSFAPNFAYALTNKRLRPEALNRFDLSSMRAFGCGSEPINPHTLREFARKLAPAQLAPTAMLPCYGMAEHTLAISFSSLHEEVRTDTVDKTLYESQQLALPPAHGDTPSETVEFVNCGKAFPGHEMATFDSEGNRLEDRKIGEIWLKGPSVARGYYENPEATEAVFGGGWLRTGDLGYLVEGEVYITGRSKDLIIVNGRNYDPQRFEWALDSLDNVRQGNAVAFSRPSSASEELVIVAESRTPHKDELASHIRQYISEQFQLACADVVIVPPGTLPKTSSGKLQRQKTRERYLKGTLLSFAPHRPTPPANSLEAATQQALSFVEKTVSLGLAFAGKARAHSRKTVEHLREIRSLEQLTQKLRLAGDYAQKRARHWLFRK